MSSFHTTHTHLHSNTNFWFSIRGEGQSEPPVVAGKCFLNVEIGMSNRHNEDCINVAKCPDTFCTVCKRVLHLDCIAAYNVGGGGGAGASPLCGKDVCMVLRE